MAAQNEAYSCMCFDEYHTQGQAPCMNGCMTMEDHFARYVVVARPPCNDPSTGTIEIPGEPYSDTTELFSTEKGKQFVHTLFAGVYSVAKESKYLSEISAENIFFSPEGEVRFHNVLVLSDGNLMQRRDRIRQNYIQACTIAKEKFAEAAADLGGEIPCDIDLLFDRVMKDKLIYNIGLYHIHMSLVPIGVGMLAYIKINDLMMTDLNWRTLQNLYAKLAYFEEFSRDATNPNDDTPYWVKEVAENTLLHAVYLYANSVNYIVSFSLIYQKTKVTRRAFNKMTSADQRLVIARTEVALFLDYLRNRTAHRMGSWLLANGGYSPEDADYACFSKFRLFMAKLQFELWVLPGSIFSKINFNGFFGYK